MFKKYLFALGLLSVLFFSCKKTKEVVIPDNTAPPDHTITNETIESYYNRLYITLLGRKPSATEADSVKQLLTAAQLSMASRDSLISHLQLQPEYFDRCYTIARTELLNGQDTNDIPIFIAIFNQYLTQPTYSLVATQLQNDINRLDTMRTIPVRLANHSMSIETMYKICINNYFYDQLNMGTENFVVSSFQHFLSRYPDTDELANGKLMVDGYPSNIFFQSGKTKDDYLLIFFSSDNYKEGVARDLYKRYLYKEPSTTKLYDLTQYYKQTQKYQAIQKQILSSDEYVFY